MSLTRKANWPSLLNAFINQNRKKSFAWGTWDCCMFAAAAIQAITGTDIAADFRTGYTTEAGAYSAIKSVCNGTTVADAAAYCAKKYGMTQRKSPLYAQRGDLLVVQNAGNLIVGLCDMHGKAACVADSGFHQFPITTATVAYQVGG